MPEQTALILGNSVGAVAAVITVLSFQCRKVGRLMLMQLISSLLFALQFIFLGALSGACVNLIGMLLRLAVIIREKRGVLPGERKGASILLSPWLWGFVALLTLSAVFTYDGPLSLIPPVSMLVYFFAIWNSDPLLLRRVNFFCCSPMWLVYNIVTCAYPGVVTECFNMASVAVSFFRFFRKKKV